MADGQMMIIEGEDFRRMQLLELDMVAEVDRVCRKHGITYGIVGGTLLGAARHKGFIPWDDDCDIAMLREDYERFREVADEMNPEICWFQDHRTDPDYPWGYAKVRRTGTKYVRLGQEHLKFRTGVMIDIFPMDDIPLSHIGQVLQDRYVYCLRKLLYADIGRMDMRQPKLKRAWWTLLSKIPREWVHDRIWGIAKHSRNDSPNYIRTLMFPPGGALYKEAMPEPGMYYGVPKTWLTDQAEFEFEGHKFFGMRDYDRGLTWMYGDWRKLPPEDQRDPHGPCSYYEF